MIVGTRGQAPRKRAGNRGQRAEFLLAEHTMTICPFDGQETYLATSELNERTGNVYENKE
jgi:hypothetical protein